MLSVGIRIVLIKKEKFYGPKHWTANDGLHVRLKGRNCLMCIPKLVTVQMRIDANVDNGTKQWKHVFGNGSAALYRQNYQEIVATSIHVRQKNIQKRVG